LLGGYNTTLFTAVDDPDRAAHFVSIRSVTPGYFDAVGLPLLRGRWLEPSKFADEQSGSVLIKATLARRLFGDEDPLGRRVGPDWRDGGLLVVGVVGDMADGLPTQPPPPAFYFPAITNTQGEMGVLLRTDRDPLAVLPAVRRIIERLDAAVPVFGVRTLQEIARSRLGTRQMAMSLFGLFAGPALLLGAIGIYGVMSFSVAQRSGELGVRLALGATRGSVLRLVLGQGARLTLPGVAAGLLLAFASARLIRSLLYEVSPLDPLTYAAVAAVLAAISLGATWLPAYRATRVDPLATIRDG
jgi:putative ABC transport system permease protein